jgi:hypothetical protein
VPSCSCSWTARDEVASRLPAVDDALNDLIAETIVTGDQLAFLVIATAALDAGRRIDAGHLEGGTGLVVDFQRLGNFAWHMEGDVPAALLAAVKSGSIAQEFETGALLVVVLWCEEKRGGVLPEGFLAAARNPHGVFMKL